MNDPADTRFFQALKDACNQSKDLDLDCREAIDRAVETGDLQDILAARKALEGLDDSLKDNLLRQVHLRMATDLSAIWDAIPGSPGTRRPN